MADAFMLQTISFGLNERLCEICDSIGFPISRANYRRFGNLTDKKTQVRLLESARLPG